MTEGEPRGYWDTMALNKLLGTKMMKRCKRCCSNKTDGIECFECGYIKSHWGRINGVTFPVVGDD